MREKLLHQWLLVWFMEKHLKTSCLAGNELVPSMTKNTAFGPRSGNLHDFLKISGWRHRIWAKRPDKFCSVRFNNDNKRRKGKET